ncbi:putative reverse transcriptase zinc-binding domain-containing protein [Helianthus annuus]|nr:putative reverse transcriptase zinc-binding domain-containing protein [Helianthus annuus]
MSGVWKTIVGLEKNLLQKHICLENLIEGKVGKGEDVRMWLDTWVGNEPLKSTFPDLYMLEKERTVKVKDYIDIVNANVTWKWRWKKQTMSNKEEDDLKKLVTLLQQMYLSGDWDRWTWKPDTNGVFSVASMKSILAKSSQVSSVFTWKWNGWVPKKLNTFMRKAVDNNIPTLMALQRRHVNVGDTSCRLCEEADEDSDHIFTSCSVATGIR